jgi:hypothetical protein
MRRWFSAGKYARGVAGGDNGDNGENGGFDGFEVGKLVGSGVRANLGIDVGIDEGKLGTAVVGFVEVGILGADVGFKEVGRDVEGTPVTAVEVGIFVGAFEKGEGEGFAEGEVVGELVILDADGIAVDGEKLGTAVVGFVEVGILVGAVVDFKEVGRDAEGMPVRAVEAGKFVGAFEEGEEGVMVGEFVVLDTEGIVVDEERLGTAVVGFVEVGILEEGKAVGLAVLGKRLVREVG